MEIKVKQKDGTTRPYVPKDKREGVTVGDVGVSMMKAGLWLLLGLVCSVILVVAIVSAVA